MDIFDPHYDLEIMELIFPEQKKNKFIDGKIGYVLDEEYKYNMI